MDRLPSYLSWLSWLDRSIEQASSGWRRSLLALLLLPQFQVSTHSFTRNWNLRWSIIMSERAWRPSVHLDSITADASVLAAGGYTPGLRKHYNCTISSSQQQSTWSKMTHARRTPRENGWETWLLKQQLKLYKEAGYQSFLFSKDVLVLERSKIRIKNALLELNLWETRSHSLIEDKVFTGWRTHLRMCAFDQQEE